MGLLKIIVFLAAAWLLLRWFEWRNLFRPSRKMEGDPAAVGLEFEDVFFMAEDARLLHGWWLPHPEARGAAIYCHGNAGNISGRLSGCADLHRLGLQVFIFDYRGYGRSKGWPTEKGTYRDARAAYEFVRSKYGDSDAPPIIAYGTSLGGAVAAQLALDRPCRGLILEGAFTSVREMGELLFPGLPIRLFSRFHYNTLAKAPRLNLPVLVSHARRDATVPYEMSERLFRALPGPKRFVTLQGEHGEAGWQTTPAYARDLEEFVNHVLGQARQIRGKG